MARCGAACHRLDVGCTIALAHVNPAAGGVWSQNLKEPTGASAACRTRHVHLPLLQESEGEEAAEARVALAQDMGRGNQASQQSRVRLQEIGPRMELQVIKVRASGIS